TSNALINAAIVVATVVVYGSFAFACGFHIAIAMRQHIRKISVQGAKVTLTLAQTRQSIIQIFVFATFLAIPLLLLMLPAFLSAAEEWILPPAIALLSLSSFIHSVTLLSSTPPFRKYIRDCLIRNGRRAQSLAESN
ncbi:hypothetical protein PMAYCL1PPCAC_16490, partial [Pristionchus mayeri]